MSARVSLGLLLATMLGCPDSGHYVESRAALRSIDTRVEDLDLSAESVKPSSVLPVANFFRDPAIVGAEVSPLGGSVGFRKPWHGRLNLFVRPRSSQNGSAIRVTDARDRSIAGFLFANESRLIYWKDTDGDENYRLYTVGVEGERRLELTPFPGVNTRLLNLLRSDPEHVLLTMNRRDPGVHDVYRANLESGELEMIVENPGNVTGWRTDHDGVVRLAFANDGVRGELLHRVSADAPFEHVLYRTTNFSPRVFTANNRRLIAVTTKGRERPSLVEYDPVRREEVRTLFEGPFGMGGIGWSRVRNVLTSVSFTSWKVERHFFDAATEALYGKLETLLPGLELSIVSRTLDEETLVIRSYSDRDQGAYHLYDVEAGRLLEIARVAPWDEPAQMAPMHPIQYRARDGLTIHGYLTLPRGERPEGLPTVVLPHGGPWTRDRWGFRSEVQFLANRGYAVLQPNFRGSTGYGVSFMVAGYKQFGRTMQDDVSDGVAWLVEQGIADPERICIYGASYGGFSALAGLAFTPDLYACGISYVGVSDLIDFVSDMTPEWQAGRYVLHERVGHPEKDRDLLRTGSPLFHADRIRAPVLIADGANDKRTSSRQSKAMVDALEARGAEVDFMLVPDEGHGFRNQENRLEFYRRMERFLAKHIGGSLTQPTPTSR